MVQGLDTGRVRVMRHWSNRRGLLFPIAAVGHSCSPLRRVGCTRSTGYSARPTSGDPMNRSSDKSILIVPHATFAICQPEVQQKPVRSSQLLARRISLLAPVFPKKPLGTSTNRFHISGPNAGSPSSSGRRSAPQARPWENSVSIPQ